MDVETIKQNIRNAVIEFNKEKSYLYDVDIYEPTLSHRVALHLENEFRQYGLVVDCEYNKNLKDPKTNEILVKIRPDIVIHERGSNENNCVIIEVKKGSYHTGKAKSDIKKLRGVTNLNYSVRMFLGILKKETHIAWIEDNSEPVIEKIN